jgi:membrane-bound lytic murein transglycosylase C
VEGRERTVCYVSFDMVADHVSVRAAKYLPLVREYAGRFDVSGNLIMAVIKTESNFNPFAVSSAGAFGLMQIVPSSAGRDVHRFLNGRDETPGRDFLFAPENNIQYGTAYLHLLQYRYLKSIENPVSREYCAIAAYNTGSGNVFKAFGVRPAAAPQKINDLSPLDVYTTLRANLPYQETRRYLVKVLDAKKNFVNM